MKNHIILAVGLTVLVAVGFVSNMPNAVAVAKQQQTQQEEAAIGVEFARLVFANEQYNWIAGDNIELQPVPVQQLINRLGGTPRNRNFGTLLDTIGQAGWELAFETRDPESGDRAWVFQRFN